MKKILCIMTALLVSITTLPTTILASTSNEENKVGVHDLANVLSESEEESLYELGLGYAKEYNLDIVFLTASDTNGKSYVEYSDDFYDGLEGDIQYGEDGILVFVDLAHGDPGEGYDYINTAGSAIENISDYEIERILDKAFEVPAEDYYGRLETMMKQAIKMYKSDSYSNSSGNSSYEKKALITGSGLVYGGIISAATVLVLLKKHNSANKQTNANVYMDESKSSFSKTSERYVRSYDTVSRGYYAKSSSSSGGSRGGSSHRSSSGRSHGGGGRRR